MQVRVLGASGGETRSEPMTCFLLNDSVAFDAGSLTRSLDIDEQVSLRAVVVSHAHLDHVRDLATIADTRAQRNAKPLRVFATAATIRALRTHLFNGAVWPDFTAIPSEKRPAIRFVEVRPGERFRVEGMTLRAIPVHHAIQTVGLIASDSGGAVVLSGDTGPTDALWEEARRVGRRLRAVLVECSFPRRMEWLARISWHLSPDSLASQLLKLGPRPSGLTVALYHFKPGFAAEIEAEVRELADGVVLARTGMIVR